MADRPPQRAKIIVETRHLDTDERDTSELQVDVPIEAAGQREQLAVAVAQVHPTAKLRSFGGGAATFLSRSHLVVAHYAEQIPAPRPSAEANDQQSLFAA